MRFFVLPLLAFAGMAWAEPERVTIPSLDGKLQLTAFWFSAATTPPQGRPAVIDLHGCGGAYDSRDRLNLAYLRDASYFTRESMHVLVLDSFTARGIKSICEIPLHQRPADERVRRDDVYAAIRWLAGRAGVDTTRIALVGRSHGGSTVLAAMDASERAVGVQPLRPRAGVALYPGCGPFVRQWTYEPAAPVLILAGELDDWTPAPRCIELRDKVRRANAGAPLELEVYPGAYHGFDGSAPLSVRKGLQTKSGQAIVGGNPEASAAAYRRMFEFLSRTLDTPLALDHEQRFAKPQALGTRPIR